MTTRSTRQRTPPEKEGDVFAIPLGDDKYGFGQVCRGLDHAYFDLQSNIIPPLPEVVSGPVVFRVPVGKHTIRAGGWKILGNLPLVGPLAEYQAYRNQPVGSNQLYICRAGQFTQATLDEVRHLEALAFWFPMHIVERLRDHLAGRPNSTSEFFKKIRTYDPQTGQEIGSG